MRHSADRGRDWLGRIPRRTLAAAALISSVALPSAPSGGASSALPMPCLAIRDADLKIPAGRLLGDVSAVAVDRKGSIWVLHRPRTVSEDRRASALPPIVRFRSDGTFSGAFGGPSADYEWPTVEHSLAVAPNGHVWISGAYRSDPAQGDDMLLELTGSGKFVRQIGRRGASKGNLDTANVHAPGDLAIDPRHNELYVADGYGNRRVIVFDASSGAYRRSWGAFGSLPTTEPAPTPRLAGAPSEPDEGDGPAHFNGVHGVAISRDGKVYVSDRNNQRVQAFNPNGEYLGQVFIDRNMRSPVTASGMAFSHDARQRYIFVVDFGNAALIVIDRRKLAVVGRVDGATGVSPPLITPHLMASDTRGNIYLTEVAARRIRRISVREKCETSPAPAFS